jgi:hypothetical protein
VYVFDGSSIITAGLLDDAPEIFDLFGELIHGHRACFPDEVLAELGRLAKDEHPNTWAKGIAPTRCHKGASYKIFGWVAQNVQDLIDYDAEHSSPAAAVLAQARELSTPAFEAIVVTEDIIDKPTRISLATACQQLDMPYVRLHECIRRTKSENI